MSKKHTVLICDDQDNIRSSLKEALLGDGHTVLEAPDGETAQSKPWGVPSPLECGSEAGVCYALPVLVEISHLAKLPELEGLCVRVETEIIDSVDNRTVLARCDNAGRLDRR